VRRVVGGSIIAVAGAALAVRAGCACSGSAVTPSTDAATDGAWMRDAVVRPRDALGTAFDAGPDAARIPPGVPDGWVPFDDYDPSCGFYVPTSIAVLPPPIQWQQCDPKYVQPPGIGCRRMVVDWTPSIPGYSGGATEPTRAWFMSSGTYVLGVARDEGLFVYLMVAEADGPVHSALVEMHGAPCVATPRDVRDGRVLYQVFDNEAKGKLSEYGGGALVANIDDLRPRVLLHYHDQGTRGYNVGLPGVLETTTSPSNGMILHDWSDGSIQQTIWSSAMDQGLQEVPISFFGNTFFFEAITLPISKVKIWDTDAGVRDFIAFGTDTTQGASDLWTDGHDMVWHYGANRSDPNGIFPTMSDMTSPFATDPSKLQPRRLRSEVGSAFGDNIQVGCGYAADGTPNGIRIVRLVDGVSWLLPQITGSTWQWIEPLAVTCSEVFASASADGDAGWQYSTIARVRLDSLGPGIPPD